jgi:hypothetical protein
MAVTKRVLGQSAPSATTLTDLYTVASAKMTTISSLVVCNRSATPTSYRLSVAPSGAADALSQYQFYDVAIDGNDSHVMTIGETLAATDKIRCYATLATLTFSAFGAEEDV